MFPESTEPEECKPSTKTSEVPEAPKEMEDVSEVHPNRRIVPPPRNLGGFPSR